tara:strand:- start:122 stop:292 length:171 start_codon:yes stop_codon:yes gene_type:complete
MRDPSAVALKLQRLALVTLAKCVAFKLGKKGQEEAFTEQGSRLWKNRTSFDFIEKL